MTKKIPTKKGVVAPIQLENSYERFYQDINSILGLCPITSLESEDWLDLHIGLVSRRIGGFGSRTYAIQ